MPISSDYQRSPIIRFDGVSKRYRLGNQRISLREALATLPARLLGRGGSADPSQEVWALKGVSFDVQPREALGIIGPNGAGKTTILRLIAGITRPIRGQVRVNGRVASMIDLSAGFHPDLTGRENIYLNAAIMGLRRKEIDRKFDSIVGFSELAQFIDTPVKRYSAGMYARLAFSVAAHVEPDIMLVDEVLAVGDQVFQKRCFAKMAEMKRAGITIVFVSHDMRAIQEVCSQVLFLWHGQLVAMDRPSAVVNRYLETVNRSGTDAQNVPLRTGLGRRSGSYEAEIVEVALLDAKGQTRQVFQTDETFRVRIAYMAHRLIHKPTFSIAIYRDDGLHCFGANTRWDGLEISHVEGTGSVELEIPALHLLRGRYLLSAGIMEEMALSFFDLHDRAYPFEVESLLPDQGAFYQPHGWRHQGRKDGSPGETRVADTEVRWQHKS